jgi:ankyrin repeat protein
MRYLFLAVMFACVSIQASAEVSPKNQNALDTAIRSCDLEGFDLLSSQGGFDPMLHARKGDKDQGMLLDRSPLSIAVTAYCRKDWLAIIEKLIRQGADPFVAIFAGGLSGPLDTMLTALSSGSKDSLNYFDLLIRLGKLDLQKGIKLTILNAESVKTDIKNGLRNDSNYNQMYRDDYSDLVLSEPTLLMLISGVWGGPRPDMDGYLNIIQRSDINAKNKAGKTALMYSVKNKYVLPHTQMLLENGADPSIKDSQGKTALDYALEKGNIDAAKLIRSFNSNAPAISQSIPDSGTTLGLPQNSQSFPGNNTTPNTPQNAGISVYAGNYSGNYTGDDNGPFQVVVDQDGNVKLNGKSLRSNQTFMGNGKISSDGSLGISLGSISTGATFQGSINPKTGAMFGTWKNSGQTGNFSGNKQPSQGQPGNPIEAFGSLLNGLSKALGK